MNLNNASYPNDNLPNIFWQDWLHDNILNLHQRSLFRTLRPTLPSTSSIQVQITPQDLNAWVQDTALPSQINATTHPTIIELFNDTKNAHQHQPSSLKTITLFSLNDYLGLSTHEAVREASSRAAQLYGNGPRSSALVGGYTYHHAALESALASLKKTESALLFPTGFAANMAIISSLVMDGNVDIFSDELNHASIIDGCRLGCRQHPPVSSAIQIPTSTSSAASSSRLHVYKHNDMDHLESLLQSTCANTANAHGNSKRRRLVVTDSLFSMDGDYADIIALSRLRRKYGFLLAVDDAHATLVCGEHGGGVAEAQGVDPLDVDLHIGTLSKAIGSLGGFVACSQQWKSYFVNAARAQVFSTSLPVPAVVAAHTALHVAEKEPWRRRHVLELSKRLHTSLQNIGLGGGLSAIKGTGTERGSNTPLSRAYSPIIPVVLGSEDRTIEAATYLLKTKGLHVPAIRPPTVPAGTSRLRISLSAGHSTRDIDGLVESIQEAVMSVGRDLNNNSMMSRQSRL